MDIRVIYTTRVGGVDYRAGVYSAARKNALSDLEARALIVVGAAEDITKYPAVSTLKARTDPVTQQTIILGPGGYPIVPKNRPKGFPIRWANGSALGDYDASTFRQIYAPAVSGRCLVMAEYVSDVTANSVNIAATAFAAGRDFSELNPFNSDGTPATWQVVNNTVVPQAVNSATLWGRAFTSPVILDIPEGGAIYIGTRAGGARRGYVTNAQRPLVDWQNLLNSQLTSMRYRSALAAIDYVNSNQNSMVATNSSGSHNPVVSLYVIPLDDAYFSIDNVGDSTGQGYPGTANGIKQEYNNNWGVRAAHRRNAAGARTAFANHAYEGWTHGRYLAKYDEFITADINKASSLVVLQPFSWNVDFFSEVSIAAGIAATKALADKLLAAGRLVVVRTVGPVGAATLAQDNFRKAGNAEVLAMAYDPARKVRVWDLDALVSNGASPAKIKDEWNLDGTHYNKAFQDFAGVDFSDNFLLGMHGI